MVFYYLVETPGGYGLFKSEGVDAVTGLEGVEPSRSDIKKVAFSVFETSDSALENMLAVNEGRATDELIAFVKGSVKKGTLGVVDAGIGKSLLEQAKVQCACNDATFAAIRWIRSHLGHYIPEMSEEVMKQSQLGLAHSFSRTRVQFNVKRSDNMVIQAVSLLDQMDKDINTFAMRVKEWYGYHFPEISKVLTDNQQYCKLVLLLKGKENFTEEMIPKVAEIVGDEQLAKDLQELAKTSMGLDFVDVDMDNILMFAQRVLSLTDYRQSLHLYMTDKMENLAPNLTALVNSQIAARLISQAGSLQTLAKYPASTLQILGAEKALFRALKTKGKTPKYGLLYNTTFIGKSNGQNKGRISRYLANKCSLATRLDCFSDEPDASYGDAMRGQVEARLAYLESGGTLTAPKTSQEVVEEVEQLKANRKVEKKAKKEKKRKAKESAEEEPAKKKRKKN